MEVAAPLSSVASDKPRRQLGLVDPYATCKSMRFQQRHIRGTCSGRARVCATSKIQPAAKLRHRLSFRYSLGPTAARLVKQTTVERAPRLQQTCLAAATQAHKTAVQLSHPADYVGTPDTEQAGLSQVLICNSKTFSAVVCMPYPSAALGLAA